MQIFFHARLKWPLIWNPKIEFQIEIESKVFGQTHVHMYVHAMDMAAQRYARKETECSRMGKYLGCIDKEVGLVVVFLSE